jgi:hypothetical protein
MNELELSLIKLGADQAEAERISATLTRIIATAMQRDPALAARGLGAFVSVFSEALHIVEGHAQTWKAERVLHDDLDDERD